MWIESFSLRNFRNYRSQNLLFSPGLNLFTGDNAQGKSNLLEAIAYTCLGRSLRGNDAQLPCWGEEGFLLHSKVVRGTGPPLTIEVRYLRGKKSLKVNGQSWRQRRYQSGFYHVSFSPDDLFLVKGEPERRRRFLDLLLLQIYPVYRRELAEYRRSLLQRNRYLHLIKEKRLAVHEIEVWNEVLVDNGVKVTKKRKWLVDNLEPYMEKTYENLSGGGALSVTYKAGCLTASEEELSADAWKKGLKQYFASDLRLGFTQLGPHRDDFLLELESRNLTSFGSQGQQRAAVLALKLAEMDLLEDLLKEKPVLMLDDVFSELDPKRRAFLIKRIFSGGQIMATATDRELINESPKDYFIFNVEKGSIERFDNSEE